MNFSVICLVIIYIKEYTMFNTWKLNVISVDLLRKTDSNVTRKKNFPWKFEAIPTTVVPTVDLIVGICFFELRRLGRTDVFVISLVIAFFMTKAVIYRKKENKQIAVIFYLPALSAFYYIYTYTQKKKNCSKRQEFFTQWLYLIPCLLTRGDTNAPFGMITPLIWCTLTFQTTVFSIMTIWAGGGAVVPIGAGRTSCSTIRNMNNHMSL